MGSQCKEHINKQQWLQSKYDFFGRNPNTPSVLTNKLPAMENAATSVIVEKNLKALHMAREAVIQSESSEKKSIAA